jgi:putative peptide zinc metalloprotease protein
MTAVRGAGAPDVGRSGGAARSPAPQVSGEVPHRADGIQLIGEMSGSGYRVPPSLVRRRDGQTVQLTGLLYAVLHAVDGHRDVGQVAEAASQATGRGISADNVRSLVDDRLRPMGLVTKADGSQPELKRSNPLLALRFRFAVTDPERTRRVTAPFAALFHPLVAVPVLVAFGLVCWWVFFEKGLASATYQAFDHPGLLILVFVVTVLSAGFHEFGHAAGARRGGATPGVMGAGVYLMWPAFYTDVTDSYRLGRGGRVRTDLGGLYFNAIVAVLVSGVWLVSGYDALLLVVATQILQMVRQLTPLVRFDGYHVLADLVGVPDLFHRIKPTLLGALPWRWGDPEARLLKPWARAVVTAWVAVVVPALLFMVFAMVVAMPHVLATAWSKLEREQAVLAGAWQHGHSTEVAARILAMAAVALPIGGTFLVITRMLRRLTRSVWRATQGRPGRRAAAGVAAAAVAAGLGFVWWPHPGTYRPIQPWDHGTVMDAVSAAPAVQAPRAGTFLEQGARGTMRTVWDTSSPLPTRAHPQLSLVLVPTDGSRPGSATVSSSAAGDGRPQGWVFPFDKPLAPGPGDNQALAVNTTDGTVDYAVAFALVWVDDGAPALNRNEAYAYSSCRSCASVAVAFQVVLVVGNNHVAAPQNLAGSLNYDCVNCLSYALAQQLFVTLDQPLSDGAVRRLDALWKRIAAFGDRIVAGQVDASDIQPALDGYQQQIKAIIGTDEPGTSATPSATPSASASSAPATTSSPGSSASAAVPSGATSTGSGTGPSVRPSSSSSSAPPSSAGPSATPSPSDADSGTSTATGTPSSTASGG